MHSRDRRRSQRFSQTKQIRRIPIDPAFKCSKAVEHVILAGKRNDRRSAHQIIKRDSKRPRESGRNPNGGIVAALFLKLQ